MCMQDLFRLPAQLECAHFTAHELGEAKEENMYQQSEDEKIEVRNLLRSQQMDQRLSSHSKLVHLTEKILVKTHKKIKKSRRERLLILNLSKKQTFRKVS